MDPGPALAAAGLNSQLGLSWAPPFPIQVAAICRLLYCSVQVAPGKAQVAADLGLHPGGPRASLPGGLLQTMLEHQPTISTSDTLKGKPHRS